MEFFSANSFEEKWSVAALCGFPFASFAHGAEVCTGSEWQL